jgi:hypothetical protein
MINSPSQQHNKNEKKTEKQLKTGDCGCGDTRDTA